MEVFKTNGVPPEARAAYWSSGYTRRFSSIAARPGDASTFNAELRIGTLGPVTLAGVRSTPTTVERTEALARRETERLFSFIMLVSGSGWASHRGRESRFSAGDVLLTDSTEPIICRFTEPVVGITARASEDVIKARLPFVDDIWGQLLPAGAAPLTDTAISMARCMTRKLDEPLPPEYAAAVAGYLLDVLAMSYTLANRHEARDETMGGVRLALIRDFVEANLDNPELTPCMVAEAVEISPRYLRKLMEQQGETLSTLILRRRLEESAKRLSSALCRGRTVTDIAFSLGFNSTAHFARVFKAKYGLTPSEYRAGPPTELGAPTARMGAYGTA